MTARSAVYQRRTKETDIDLALTLDGSGEGEIATGIPFLDHMLTLFAYHGCLELKLRGRGDTEIDDHHLVEDIGICLGEALREALGGKEGIRRYGQAAVPMDEALCELALDFSGRPYLVYRVDFGGRRAGTFDLDLLREFFKAFADHAGMTLHIHIPYGNNAHHMAEAMFKAFAVAVRAAVSVEQRRAGVPSTKGSL